MDARTAEFSCDRTRRLRIAAAEAAVRAEIVAVLIGAVWLAGYLYFVLASGRVPFADFTWLLSVYLGGALALWLIIGLVALLVLLWRGRPRNGEAVSPLALVRNWAAGRWHQDRYLGLFWPPLLFATLMASFNSFKQMILPQAGFLYDPLFARLDRLLFAGEDGWALLHRLFGSVQATHWIDLSYHGWFAPMSLGVLLCAYGGRSSFRLRTQYLLTYMMVWIVIGSVLAWFMPAAGPCFYERFAGPELRFAALMQSLRADDAMLAAQGSGVGALRLMERLDQAFGGQHLVVGAGISAMPSVHNGLAVLFALAASRIDRRFGAVMAVYALLIWIGSIYLGWHYAIDGIFAALLTIALWKFSGRLAEGLARRHGL